MSLPVCPKCGSGNVIPSQLSAGHNQCLSCNAYLTVAEFHKPVDPTRLRFYNVRPSAEIQRGNQTYRKRGHPSVIYGKTQRPATQPTFWWEKDD